MTGRTPGQAFVIGGGALVAGVMVVIGGYTAVDHSATATRHEHLTFSQPIRRVLVDAEATSVALEGTPGERVTVDRTVTESIRRASPNITVVGDTLRLTGGCVGFPTTNCSVRYEIHVPSTVDISARTTHGSLAADDMNADVSLRADSGEVAASNIHGRTTLSANSGRIVADHLAGGPVTLQADSGSIIASGVSADRLSARAESGRILVDFTTAPTTVEARADSGSVSVFVPPDRTARYDLHLNADSGRVANDGLPVDETSDRSIDASARSGSVVVGYTG